MIACGKLVGIKLVTYLVTTGPAMSVSGCTVFPLSSLVTNPFLKVAIRRTPMLALLKCRRNLTSFSLDNPTCNAKKSLGNDFSFLATDFSENHKY